jgi:hypothetical protein
MPRINTWNLKPGSSHGTPGKDAVLPHSERRVTPITKRSDGQHGDQESFLFTMQSYDTGGNNEMSQDAPMSGDGRGPETNERRKTWYRRSTRFARLTYPARNLYKRKDAESSQRKKTPIERLFEKVFKREMTQIERLVLVVDLKKKRRDTKGAS